VIISRQHRYIYVQVPQTGSTAVGNFLVAHADGHSVLRKHTTLDEARRMYGPEIHDFTVIASVRDPVDQLVSSFYKLVGTASTSVSVGASNTPRRSWALAAPRTLDDYVSHFVRHVHAPGWVRSARDADVLVRFEDLEAGVAEIFRRIGVPQASSVPRENETPRKASQALGPQALERLAVLYGPFAREFGYGIGGSAAKFRLTRQIQYEIVIRAKVRRRRRNLLVLRAEEAASAVRFNDLPVS